MAALAADSKVNFAGLGPRQTRSFIIANAAQLYVGSILRLNGGRAATFTTGNTVLGVAVGPGVPGNNPVLDGFTLSSLPIPMIAPGNTGAAAGNEPRVVVEMGAFTWEQVTLTLASGTLAGTIADVGVKVYAASDNVADSTNTQPGTDKPLGVITRFYSATATLATYDILVDSYDARTRGN